MLYLQARRGPCIPLGLIVEVIRWGSLFIMDAFDMSLEGTYHETFMRRVMAPPAGVRVGGRPRFSCEEVMERFRDIFDHPHELVIRMGWRRALRHRVANGLYDVAETKRECCWGAPDEVFQRERLSSSKLCHDVGEQEGEVVRVLLGRSGS